MSADLNYDLIIIKIIMIKRLRSRMSIKNGFSTKRMSITSNLVREDFRFKDKNGNQRLFFKKQTTLNGVV